VSLKAFVEAVVGIIKTLDEVLEQLREEKRAGGNPPPEVSVHDRVMARWPTRGSASVARPWPPFEGHRTPLGGDRA